MRVLHIEMGKNLYGGARQLVYLIEGLNDKGVESILFAPTSSAITESISALGNPMIEFDYRGDLDARMAFAVKRACKEFSIDLVQVHSRRGADIWGGLGAKWAQVPAVLSRRVDNPEGRLSVALKYPLFNQVISISEGIKKVLVDNGVGTEKITCVRSAFVASDSQKPIGRLEFLQRFSLLEDSLVMATVAQLIPRKGHKLLIECLPELVNKYPNLQVIFFGEGAERTNLEQQISSLGLANHIQLAGFEPDLNILIGNVDILVHPAYTEGLGVSLIQASAASVPIVASEAGGMPEIVRDGENGLLVPPGKKPELVTAIDRLAGSPQLRREMGLRGKAIAEQEFSVPVMVEGNLTLYRNVLSI
jgi:glycosyltransferase involved in cell wall biosynthesis